MKVTMQSLLLAIALAVPGANAQWITDPTTGNQMEIPAQLQPMFQPSAQQPVQPRSTSEWFYYYDRAKRKMAISDDAQQHLNWLMLQTSAIGPQDQDFVQEIMKRYQDSANALNSFLPISATERLQKSFGMILQQKAGMLRDFMSAQMDPNVAAQYGPQLVQSIKTRQAQLAQLENSTQALDGQLRQYYQIPPPAQQAPEEQ